MIIFKNNSGSTIAARSLINLTGIELQDNGEFRVTADQCDSAANFLIAVTGVESVDDGKYGSCDPVGNLFLMQYDSGDGTPANEESWGPDNATFKLKKNFGGGAYAVIGADTESVLALVMHTGAVKRWGKADANIAGAGSGTVSVYVGTGAPTSWTDSGDNVTARNITDQQADSGNFVELYYSGSQWNLIPLECPA